MMHNWTVNKSDFGTILRSIRMHHGLTQDDLAELSGSSQQHISCLERGTDQPTLETMHKLSRALGVIFTVRG